MTLAADGLQALEGLRREHFDLALLDYHMPLTMALLRPVTPARRLPGMAGRGSSA